MIHAAICDDNAQDRAHLRALLSRCCPTLRLAEYDSAEALLWDIDSGKAQFELYFLEIHLPGLSGVEAARRLRAADEDAVLVFVTNSDGFYRDAFDVYALNYLLKPAAEETLCAVVENASRILRRRKERTLAVTCRGRVHLLRHESIEYISSSNHTVLFHLHTGEERVCYDRLDRIAERLNDEDFVRCHQSHIVNLRHVLELIPGGFRMAGTVIPISRAYAKAARHSLHRYLSGLKNS